MFRYIQFSISSNSEIEDGNYNVTLNIKNRVLREEDKNIFALSDPFMGTQKIMDKYIFSLVQKDNNIKLTGSYTLKEGAGVCIGFYSPIIENYLDVYTSSVQTKNTTGITSSSGKPLKFGIYKTSAGEIANGKPPYILFLGYQDGSTLEAGDTITFNLTPDKNSTLNPIYSPVANVQQAIEAIVLNRIYPIGSYYIQFAELDGTFDINKSPEKLFGGTWTLLHNNQGVFIRTEGGNANEGRLNGIQQDSVQRFTAYFRAYSWLQEGAPNGILRGDYHQNYSRAATEPANINTTDLLYNLDSSFQIRSGSETRGINILIRIWLRIA